MNRKGSVTVFLMIFFVSIVSCTAIFISQSERLAVKGCAESISTVTAQAILAEYDINLKNRYELLGFYGLEKDVNSKCSFYVKKSLGKKKYVRYEGASCSIDDYSLCNIKVFEKQVKEAGKLALAGKLIPSEEKHENLQKENEIKNESISYYLPSKGVTGKIHIERLAELLKNAGSVKDIAGAGKDRVLINAYADNFFSSASGGGCEIPGYFSYEKEYLVAGKLSDSGNSGSVRNRIIGIREILNYAYLKKDSVKYAEALAAAEILTPGPQAAVTCEALLASWALAESVNDYKLLINSHKVPVMKTAEMWAVDLDSVINNQEKGCIFTGIERGETYDDYLTLFLYEMDKELLLLRMMDLVQINMKYLYYGDFYLKEYNGGVKVSFTLNGDDYECEKEY